MTKRDKFYDTLRGKKYVYFVKFVHCAFNQNIIATSEEHAVRIAKQPSQVLQVCEDVTETFQRLNNTLSNKDIERLEPGILSIRFAGNTHEWITGR